MTRKYYIASWKQLINQLESNFALFQCQNNSRHIINLRWTIYILCKVFHTLMTYSKLYEARGGVSKLYYLFWKNIYFRYYFDGSMYPLGWFNVLGSLGTLNTRGWTIIWKNFKNETHINALYSTRVWIFDIYVNMLGHYKTHLFFACTMLITFYRYK